jgi:GT2 family glycosyltransferase
MIGHNKDIVGAVYPTWKNDTFIWLVCKLSESGAYIQYPSDYRHGLREVDALGTGCMLIKRKVLETVSMPFIDKVREGVGDRELGHDLYFCRRAKELGFEVWADWDVKCEHYKNVNLLPLIRMFEGSNI